MLKDFICRLACFAAALTVGMGSAAFLEVRETATLMHIAAHETPSAHDQDAHHGHDHQTGQHSHKHRHAPTEPEHEHSHTDPGFLVAASAISHTPVVSFSIVPRLPVLEVVANQSDVLPTSIVAASPFRPPIS